MPPRGDPGRGRGGGPPRGGGGGGRGGGGGGGPRGGGGGRGRGGPPPARGGLPPAASTALPGEHVQVVGVRRSGYGSAGRPITVASNFFNITPPEGYIHHYDGKLYLPSEKTLPARLNMDLVNHLMSVEAVDIFTPPAVYDGRKNMFAPRKLALGPSDSQEFNVSLSDDANRGSPGENTGGRGPKVYKIRLTKVATINPEVLQRFIMGKQSHDNTVLTALTALNVVIRMEPTMKYPFNVRSFFTDREVKDIGSGIVLWRGYFQSVRPAIGRLLVNVDISTGTMYKAGPLIDLCLDFLGRPGQPQLLSPQRGMPDRERIRLQRFIAGVRITTTYTGQRVRKTPRVVKKLSSVGASSLSFTMRDGTSMTVAQYFRNLLNRPLKYPDNICVEVGAGALIPVELCVVPKGQIMRKQVPPEKTKDVLEFATKRPHERLASISNGLSVLAYGQSQYMREFGMRVDDNSGPINLPARVLPPPKLRYGQGSPQPVVTPANGAWNMIDKRFFRPATIDRWIVVVYERQQRFNQQSAQDMINGLVQCSRDVGMRVNDTSPMVTWQNGQGRIADQLRQAGNECFQQTRQRPTLIVVILPDNANDIYTAVKHFGDVTVGVATQCLKSSKCYRAKPQYYANVCLKINVKLGGINTIPDPQSVSILTDPRNPTVVMGADVIHPAPGSEGRPSFTALVGNVDSDTAKYIATCRVQTSRKEIIEDLSEMAQHILDMYMKYRRNFEKKTSNIAPTRLIFFRDGVSEGQFREVLEFGRLALACRRLNINPKITMIVVAKRHHVRLFTTNPGDADRSGNCPAGTVVDQVIAHPVEFDWYLISHGGLLGTSRPAHYNVLYDDNKFQADGLQSLAFALCHVYARSTRSVSIPAPVYYADIVCSRAKNHYDPQGGINLSDTATHTDTTGAESALEAYKRNFKPLHNNMTTLMYFS
ncbi:argonaute-like protein [Pisolithus orientalis]|uniref:argonaute-like protein n=1 Tax=Pisolithus orientalis TaxID=936130 RepID=UPI0022241346|nr:argonaute-like protein [Pisolithus orientalis]KAI6035170.1 argonaute-like protein [Pisolithus orientalis]